MQHRRTLVYLRSTQYAILDVPFVSAMLRPNLPLTSATMCLRVAVNHYIRYVKSSGFLK